MSDAAIHTATRAQIQEALDQVANLETFTGRLAGLSEHFLGAPYLAFTLIGGPDEDEQLVTRLDGFDCVTFVESVLALAWSRVPEDFPRNLRAIRYHAGRCTWLDRNHYMSRWIARNTEAHLVEPLLEDEATDTGEIRQLSSLPGYPAQDWPVRYVPSTALPSLAQRARPGDVVCFMSNKPVLDTFHVGLLIPGPVLAVRHASRSRAQVVHQDLDDFLERNDVPGMLLARPSPHALRSRDATLEAP
ncbi:MAG TPA: DUF1460 domain-containing protein [Deltaproteobacteria bacterium]|nr:DUF1460 domain-containing protein [Deltaproteobacteria bacterium]